MRSVVVTGTSTGIGFASAKMLIERGYRVFGSVRKQADADRLCQELGINFVPLLFDVTDENAVHAAAREVRMALKGGTLAGLVNNAGIVVAGPALELPIDDFRRQMDVNIIAPIIVTQAFAPLLGADRTLKGGPGRMVMIGSVAGQSGNPLMSAYSTSKFAIEGLAESLRREFMLFGIDVIVIAPGPVKTAIWGKAIEVDDVRFHTSPFFPMLERLRGMAKALHEKALPPEKVAALVLRALTASSPRVRYVITPEPVQQLMTQILPKRWLDRIIARILGLSRLP